MKALLPYTRKAWAALVGVGLSWVLTLMQDPDVLDWFGQIPDLGPIPTNRLLLTAIPFITLWVTRERAKVAATNGVR